MIIEVIIGLLVIVAALNIWATIRVAGDQLVTPWQRAAHIMLVWVFPVLGALIVLHLQRAESKRSFGRYANDEELGDDFGYIGRTLGRADTAALALAPWHTMWTTSISAPNQSLQRAARERAVR
jgi:hypothetical protein